MKQRLNSILKHIIHAGGNLDHWLIASLIALLISLAVTILVHGVEQHDARIGELDMRVKSLEAVQ